MRKTKHRKPRREIVVACRENNSEPRGAEMIREVIDAVHGAIAAGKRVADVLRKIRRK